MGTGSCSVLKLSLGARWFCGGEPEKEGENRARPVRGTRTLRRRGGGCVSVLSPEG